MALRRNIRTAMGGLTLGLAALLASGTAMAAPGQPVADKKPVTENFFGTSVTDDYRWMEESKSPEFQAFMKGQADYTTAVLAKIPGRDALEKRIVALDNASVKVVGVNQVGDSYFYRKSAPGAANYSLVVRQGAKVVLEVQRELVRLLEGLDGVAAVIARGETLPSFDLHCPLLSLPLAFGTEPATIPAPAPYIAAAGDEIRLWRELLPRGQRRIGVAWAGDPAHDNDVNRSMRLKALAPVFDMPDVDFVSLQYKTGEKDVGTLQDFPNLFRLERSFRDFADTAAVVASLDAVISVDSAVAHLAGAMGTELFVLLPLGADFRWLRERADSPWYPTARLLRQTQFGDWSGVIESLAAELRARFCPAACKLSA